MLARFVIKDDCVMRVYFLLFFFLSVVVISGCSEVKPPIETLEPSKYDEVGYVIDQLRNSPYGHVQFILYPDNGKVLSSDTLRTVGLLTERAWNLPYSQRVDSVTNYQQMSNIDDNFQLHDLIPNVQNATDASLQKAIEIIKREPSLVDRLYYPDSSATLIDVRFHVGKNKVANKMLEIADAAVTLKKEIEFSYPVTVHLTGNYVGTVRPSSKALMFDLTSDTGRNGIFDVNYLLQLASFSAWIGQQPGVVNVVSYSDLVKKINKALHDDNEAWNILPDSGELAAQYLLLFELSSPFGLGLEHMIGVDRSFTRVTAIQENASSETLLALQIASAEWLKRNAPNIEFDPSDKLIL